MLKHIVVIFILGVLLREASADMECFLKDIGGLMSLPQDENLLCNEYVKKWRGKLKECDVTKVNLDGLDSHVKEVCTEGTDLRKDYLSSKQCFETHAADLSTCTPKLNVRVNGGTMSSYMKEYCKQRKSVNSCISDKVGKPCGKAGMNVISKGQIASESYMKDICYLVGGAAANSIFMWLVVMCVSITMLKWY